MARFGRKKKGGLPAVSTASLPDIVFMLLFFFMVTTVMREVDLQVTVEQPEAVEVQKLENKSEVMYVYIGPPVDERLGTEPRIQLADDFATMQDVGPYIETVRETKPEQMRNRLTTSLKVDKTAKMGVITDVKQELRDVYALKLMYSTRESAAR